jgi:hypothetical protein
MIKCEKKRSVIAESPTECMDPAAVKRKYGQQIILHGKEFFYDYPGTMAKYYVL